MKVFIQPSFSPRAVVLIAALLFLASSEAIAGSWHGIEPFKSRRADVLQILGQPINQNPNGPLVFKVSGGTVSVSFVDANFVRTKKLRPDIEGTVLQIILQHENSSDTPESLNLSKDRDFDRDNVKDAIIFRNLKEGIVYTFIGGKLKTTRYTFSENQISRARH
jgi:hypothetical protein